MLVFAVFASFLFPSAVKASNCEPERGVNCVAVDLRERDFSGTDLSGANFKRSDLRSANFSDAMLQRANFQRSRLINADFQNAYLQSTDFTRARMRGSQFLGAYLSGARFASADLTGVDLSQVETDGSKGRKALQQEVLKAKLCRTTLPNGQFSMRDC